jgi:hypothetical protein
MLVTISTPLFRIEVNSPNASKMFALDRRSKFSQINTVDFGTLPASTNFKKPPNADSSERFLPFHAEMPKSSSRSDRTKLFSLQNFSVASICRRYESFDDCFRLLNLKYEIAVFILPRYKRQPFLGEA